VDKSDLDVHRRTKHKSGPFTVNYHSFIITIDGERGPDTLFHCPVPE
jgi:hypothetical protein